MNSQTTNALYAAWGDAADDVWAVGDNGVVVHFNGVSWSVESPPTSSNAPLYSVSGTGPNDVWVNDTFANVWHFEGAGWTQVNALVPPSVIDLTLFDGAPGSLWVSAFTSGGYGSSFVLYPATSTTLGNVIPGTATLLDGQYSPGLWAFSADDVWGGGQSISHWTGAALSTVSTAVVSLWGASPQSIFAGTGSADVAIYDGASWTPSNTGTAGGTAGVWGTSSSRVYVATNDIDIYYGDPPPGEVRSYDGVGWANEPIPAGTPALFAIYAAPTGEVYAFGAGGTILVGP
jgi:hypothetical protein